MTIKHQNKLYDNNSIDIINICIVSDKSRNLTKENNLTLIIDLIRKTKKFNYNIWCFKTEIVLHRGENFNQVHTEVCTNILKQFFGVKNHATFERGKFNIQ